MANHSRTVVTLTEATVEVVACSDVHEAIDIIEEGHGEDGIAPVARVVPVPKQQGVGVAGSQATRIQTARVVVAGEE